MAMLFIFGALQDERVIIANEAKKDPRTCEFDSGYLADNNIKSKLDAPIRLDGEIICIEQQNAIRKWTNDEASFVGTLSDLATIALISDRKTTAENGLFQSQKIASLARLAGGIAHDFNNLLTVISGVAETLQVKTKQDASGERLITLVLDANARASRLTKNLLAFGGNQPLKIETVSSHTLCTNIQSLVTDLIREDIELKFFGSEVQAWTNGDIAQLEQVLLNLMLNAVDAMPDGGQISVSFSSAANDYFIVRVHDDGEGIDAEVKKHIFDPFFTTNGEKGTGLGLSVCQGIVQQHRGKIECTSPPGKGTFFEVKLPRVRPSNSEETATKEEPIMRPSASGLKILLVEDEAGVRSVVTQMLMVLDFVLIVAEDAKHALVLLEENDVDLLLTDVVMPDIQGPEIYKKARQNQPELLALFVSGYPDDVLSEIPLADKAVGYLTKPFTMAELQTALEQLISLH
jgi:two-component system cell cycle sensor histidine kinase/response regulator CckA